MTQPQSFLLPDVRYLHHIRNRSDLIQQIGFSALLQDFFELERNIKVILNGILPATGYYDEALQS